MASAVALVALLVYPNLFFSDQCSANTHFWTNAQRGTIESVSDSPFQIRQPHSLSDLLSQIDWINELSAIRTFIKGKQVNIDQRYGEDDPEIEKKVREADEDCVRSNSMELQTENFVVVYPIDIMPKFVLGSEQLIYSTKQTLRLEFLEQMFEFNNSQSSAENSQSSAEPKCEQLTDDTTKKTAEMDKELRSFISEHQLAQISEDELRLLGQFLGQKLSANDEKTRQLALYYANFYWRIRGDPFQSQQCLLAYLKRQPNSLAAILQSGFVHLRVGDYPHAVKLLQSVNSIVTDCGACLMALGDAFVLDGNYRAAIKVFDMAFSVEPNEQMAMKKASLLRCTLKLFEVMENQHRNLLEIIKDKEAYRDKMKRMQQLETLIEQNRDSPENRLQARLSHNYLEFGCFPYLKCRDGTQWINGIYQRKRLFCTVNNWTKFEEAKAQREREKMAQKREKIKETEEKRAKIKSETDERKRGKTAEGGRDGGKGMEKGARVGRVAEQYLSKLGPFIGMRADEPQLRPENAIEKKTLSREVFQLDLQNWPSLTECRKFPNEFFHRQNHLQQLFISPQNKGFITADFFTKYLGLENGQLTPLPWNLPHCDLDHIGGELAEELKFILKLDGVKRLKSAKDDSKNYAERMLRDEFSKMIGFESKGHNSEQQLMMGEIGQRIANLIKFDIGPKWMSLNFAALFFRFLGFPSEAINCLEAALKFPQYLDIALTQLAQLLFNLNLLDTNAKESEGIERILSIAMQKGSNEPIPYHLMGAFHLRQNRSILAERLFRQSLERDPNFEPALIELLRMKCSQRVTQKVRLFRDVYAPICCWPNEQNVVCFEQRAKASKRKSAVRCFRLELPPNSSGASFAVRFVYFRCNTPYTGRSYPPPPFAPLVGPLLRPSAELRQTELRRFIQQIEADESLNSKKIEKSTHRPVLSLDHGGYSEERIKAHLQPIWPEGISPGELRQRLDFDANGNEKEQFEPNASSIDRLQNRHQVVASLDIALPNDLPIPPSEMVKKGESLSPSISRNSLAEICQSHRKAFQLLEQPVSSWVSVTAKGIKVEDLFDLESPLPAIDKLEPECSDPAFAFGHDAAILRELDSLPAYRYRHHLTKFYKPEKALRNTLRSLGSSGGFEQTEHVAARLYFALRTDEVHWALSTLSALYWRVKGDPANAIKCLRHSLHKAPNQFKDVPLISLANIYHQAGFLHSALIVGRKALDAGVDVVALHFTLANIYASLADFPHALQFYHSTLALQSNFEPANLRILAVHCITNGTLLSS